MMPDSINASGARPAGVDPALQAKLDSLTRGTALASLTTLIGSEEACSVWADACESAGVSTGEHLPLDEMMSVADVLSAKGGAVGLVGSSLAIRINTYLMLQRSDRLGRFLGGDA